MLGQPRRDAWFLQTGFDSDDGTGSPSPTTDTSGDVSPTTEVVEECAAFRAGEHPEFFCSEVTVSVPVPTSDHVAEIIGKRGRLSFGKDEILFSGLRGRSHV